MPGWDTAGSGLRSSIEKVLDLRLLRVLCYRYKQREQDEIIVI